MALAGCASYTPAPIDLDRLPRDYAQRRIDAPGLRSFVAGFLGSAPVAWPPADLDLDTLQAIALFHRPERRASLAHLAEANAARAVAAQPANPRLAVGPGVVGNPGDQVRWLATIGLTFPLDLSGQRSARMAAGDRETDAARLDVARADQAIRIDVVEKAFALALAEQIETLDAELARLQTEAAALVEKRSNAGAADAIQLDVARVAAHRASVAHTASVQDAAAARLALAAALGLPASALAGVVLPGNPALPELDAATAQRCGMSAVRCGLDVAAALCSYAQKEALLRLEVARQWPDIELGPGYEYDQGLHKYRLDFGLALPLFHGNGAAIEQATAARTAAALAVEAAQTRVVTEVEAALRTFARQRQERAAADLLVATTTAAVARAERCMALGAADRGAVIAARIDEVEARTALAQQEYRAAMAWLRLEVAAQQPIGPGLLAWQHAVPEGVS